MAWFVIIDGVQKGPVFDSVFDELVVKGVITPETKVRRRPKDDWAPFRTMSYEPKPNMYADIKPQFKLEKSQASASVAVKELVVKLEWTADVDLDLTAFYKTKDGKTGGVFSENYPGGNLGTLTTFPYIELSGDAGLGASGGRNQEIIQIDRLDDMQEVRIVTINYTDAVEKRTCCFADYDGKVTVINKDGERIEVPLNSRTRGHVAVICLLECAGQDVNVMNINEVLSLDDFLITVPGANTILE